MLVSMTGFSTITLHRGNAKYPFSLTLTLRSLNSRYLEVSCKLPFALQQLENECVKRIKENLIRGTVTLSVYVTNPAALKSTVNPSLPVIEGYVASIKTIQDKFSLPGSVTINDIIGLPNTFEMSEQPLDEETTSEFMRALDALLKSMLENRMQEGTQLERDVLKRLAILHDLIQKIESLSGDVVQHRKEELLKALKALGDFDINAATDQQLQLIQHQLDRLDITEELVRFKTHLANAQNTIADTSTIEKGKKLDFILQEMFREVNTIAAKCGDARISTNTISMKVELEKIREQLQNIV
jgi:uncharacterized protein (TIGR00255 family)